MDTETKLIALLRKAEQTKKKDGIYHTKADTRALEDMMQQAKLALEGKNQPPHSGRRGFLMHQDRRTQMEFAIRHYTMAPTYLEHGVWSYYGLEEALRWYQSRDLRKEAEIQGIPETGERQKELARKKAEFLDEEYEKLQVQRFLPDMEDDLLFVSTEELEDIKRAVIRDPFAKEQYKKILDKAQEMSLEEIRERYQLLFEPEDYPTLNHKYFLWSSTASNLNFTVPANTKFGRIQFVLPSEENEAEGLGHVWIDEVEILSASGAFDFPRNGGFERISKDKRCPALWEPVKRKGNPVLFREERYPFCGKEQGSIYMENQDQKDEGMWRYEEDIPFLPGEIYTLKFWGKVDGKFKRGVRAEILFFNHEGKQTGSFTTWFNKKSWIPCSDYNLRMQCDAVCYAVTGNREYAQKAKYEILHFMDDFLQGAEYWMRENKRPEGSDAYGAVQGGRNLCSIALTYDLIRRAEIFSREEKECFFTMLEYFLRYMMDKRDRSLLSLEEAQKGCSNWQLDMCIGTVMVLWAVPDFPDRKQWILSGQQVIQGLIICNVNPDGSWPESLRYHHAALERLAQYARVLLRKTGEDWFSQKYLQKMFQFSIEMQTPPYIYFQNRRGTPPFGDHALSGGDEFSCHGLYCTVMEKRNKPLADQMYRLWKQSGKPVKRLWGESIILENLLYAGEDYKPAPASFSELVSSADYPDSGIYIFRKEYGKEQEGFCAVMASPKPVAHGHLDQGSFMIYKDRIPVILDSGIEGYFDSSTQWHISSYSHAVMQFEGAPFLSTDRNEEEINLSAGKYSRKRGWEDTPGESQVKKCYLGEEEEYIILEVRRTQGAGRQIRTVYHHRETDLYLIRDQVLDFQGKILFSVPTVMKENHIQRNQVTGDGYYGVNLQTFFLSSTEKIWTEKGRCTPCFPASEKIPMLSYIRAVSKSSEGFLVLISPNKERNIKTASQKEGCVVITFWQGRELVLRLPDSEV